MQEFGAAHVILGSDYPYDMGTFECARQVKALSCGEMDKLTMLNGLVQKLLAGVKYDAGSARSGLGHRGADQGRDAGGRRAGRRRRKKSPS